MSTSQSMKSGWDYIADLSGANLGGQSGEQYIDKVESAIQELTDQINSKEGFATGIGQLKGFVAEDWHAGTFNINAALRDSSNRAYVEGSNAHASVDVSTNYGQDYSLKYYATGIKSAQSQAKDVIQAYYEYLGKSKAENPLTFEEYLAKNGYSGEMAELLQSVYHGQGRIIPSDQLDEAIKYLQREIAKESMKEGANRAAVLAKYEETLSKLSDRIKDGQGVESTPLTKEEAETIAKLCKEGDFKPEDFGLSLEELVTSEFILQQALKAGCTAAVLTVVFQIAPHIYKAFMHLIREGEINVDELKTIGLKGLSGSAEGFLRGSIASALTIAAQAGKLGEEYKNINAGVIGAVTFIVLSTVKNSILVATGKMTSKELGVILVKEVVISGASIAGGTIGQLLLPELPVIGYMLGSLVGSTIASGVVFAGEKLLLAFCTHSGFTCFGLVDQNYELPPALLEHFGYEIAELEKVELEAIELETAELETITPEKAELEILTDENGIEYKFLRRGVVGFYKVAFV